MNTTPKSVYSTMLDVACSVIEMSYPLVRLKYKDLPLCFLEYVYKEEKESSMEIRFNEFGVTLFCSFTENICKSSLLFWDNTHQIKELVSYLNNCYDFCHINNHWTLPECFLKIKVSKKDTFVALYKTADALEYSVTF